MTIRIDTVCMYISCRHNKQRGSIYYALEYLGNVKEVFMPDIEENTPNRAMLLSIVDAIGFLKRPCQLIVYSKTHLGQHKLYNPYQVWINRDIGNLILQKAKEGGHTVEIRRTQPPQLEYEKIAYLDMQHFRRVKRPRE